MRPARPAGTAGTDARVYFYPHAYLRERQLETIRRWPAHRVANPEILFGRRGMQVPRFDARAGLIRISWKQRLPLPNIKRRPRDTPDDALVYVWGGVTSTGAFIVELDNPYALVGYNLRAMPLWQPLLRHILSSSRCVEIRCISRACATTLADLFGTSVARKARVVYPVVADPGPPSSPRIDNPVRFLFIGTQFEIKGGAALLRAFPRVRRRIPDATLDVVTHLPTSRVDLADQPGVRVHPATLSPQQLAHQFFGRCHVLVHPTYVESFGLVVLEALAHGLGVVATDVYAIPEMVEEGVNGRLVQPPLSVWDAYRPSPLYHRLADAPKIAARIDTGDFEHQLAAAMVALALDRERLAAVQRAARSLYEERFRPS